MAELKMEHVPTRIKWMLYRCLFKKIGTSDFAEPNTVLCSHLFSRDSARCFEFIGEDTGPVLKDIRKGIANTIVLSVSHSLLQMLSYINYHSLISSSQDYAVGELLFTFYR